MDLASHMMKIFSPCHRYSVSSLLVQVEFHLCSVGLSFGLLVTFMNLEKMAKRIEMLFGMLV